MNARVSPTIYDFSSPIAHPPRVLFLGMQGRFSYAPLLALLEAGIQVSAVVIPAEQSFDEEQPAISEARATSIISFHVTSVEFLYQFLHSSTGKRARYTSVEG